MVVAGLCELGEEVDTTGVGALVVRETETLDFFDLIVALVGAVHGESGDGVHTLIKADALGKEDDGVLP